MADTFLSRFDPDPQEAERKCEDLWRRLVFYFQHRLIPQPEDRAQEVFYRLLNNLPDTATSYLDVVMFSFGIARMIILERAREPESPELPSQAATAEPDPEEQTAATQQATVIRDCLQTLGSFDEELIENWYLDGRKAHAEIAERLNLTANALRLKVFRIKNRLEECLEKRGLSLKTRNVRVSGVMSRMRDGLRRE